MDGWVGGFFFCLFCSLSYQLLFGLAFCLIDPAFVTETTSSTNALFRKFLKCHLFTFEVLNID